MVVWYMVVCGMVVWSMVACGMVVWGMVACAWSRKESFTLVYGAGTFSSVCSLVVCGGVVWAVVVCCMEVRVWWCGVLV